MPARAIPTVSALWHFITAEAQILQRAITLAGVDNGLQISSPLVVAGFAPD
jgi:hypothetical protein